MPMRAQLGPAKYTAIAHQTMVMRLFHTVTTFTANRNADIHATTADRGAATTTYATGRRQIGGCRFGGFGNGGHIQIRRYRIRTFLIVGHLTKTGHTNVL